MKTTLKLLFLLFSINAFSQSIDLKWSEEFKKRTQITVIGTNNGDTYGYFVGKGYDLTLRKFNSQAKLVKEQEITLPLSDDKYEIITAIMLDNKINFFVVERDRRKDQNTLILCRIGLDFKVEKKALILDEASDRKRGISTFIINISSDSTKCFVYHTEVGKRNDPEQYNLKVFDSKFTSSLWEKRIEMPYKDKDYEIVQFAVDNFSNVYCLSKITIPKKERNKDEDAYKFNLTTFAAKTASPKELIINFPNSRINSASLLPGTNSTLICAGFYEDLKSGIFGKYEDNVSNGFFSLIIDCATLAIQSKFNDKVEGIYPEKIKYKDRIPYVVRKLYTKSDGGYIVLAEQYQLIITTSTNSKGVTTTTYHFYYCDIVAIEIASNSKVVSVTRIPKYQLNSSQPSISSCYYNDKLYIFYVDLIKNLDNFADSDIKTQSSGWFSDKKVCLTLGTVDFKSKPKKEMVFNCKELDIYPSIMDAFNVTNHSLVFRANTQIGILTIK